MEPAASPLLSLQGAAGNRAVEALLPADPGAPLQPSVRERMEHQFRVPLGSVVVHSGPRAEEAARRFHARAFTFGSDVWLGRGVAPSDVHVMSHELAHVIQQSRSGGAPRPEGLVNTDASLEGAAEDASSRIAAGQTGVEVQGAAGAAVQRIPLPPPAPQSLEASLDPAVMSDDDLTAEIQEIQDWLAENPDDPLREEMEFALVPLVDEALRRRRSRAEWTEAASGAAGWELEEALADVRSKSAKPASRAFVEGVDRILAAEIESRQQPLPVPTTAREMMERLESAKRVSTLERPDHARALALAQSVLTWLEENVPTGKVTDRFRGHGFNLTAADTLAWNAYGNVGSVTRRLRSAVRQGVTEPWKDGYWSMALGSMKAAQEYFEIYTGERRYEDSPIATAVEDYQWVPVAVAATILILPVAVAAGAEALPLLAGGGELALAAGAHAGRSVLIFAATRPELALALAEVGVGTVLQIEAVGLEDFLLGLTTPEGAAATALDILTIWVACGSGARPTRVRSVQGNHIEVEIVGPPTPAPRPAKPVEPPPSPAPAPRAAKPAPAQPAPAAPKGAPPSAPPPAHVEPALREPASAPTPVPARPGPPPSATAAEPAVPPGRSAAPAPEEAAPLAPPPAARPPAVEARSSEAPPDAVRPRDPPFPPGRKTKNPRGTTHATATSTKASKKSEPEVVKGRTSPRATLSPNQQAELTRLEGELADAKALLSSGDQGRTVAVAGDVKTVSGVGDPPEGFIHVPASRVAEEGRKAGHEFRPAGAYDTPEAGYHEVHAEKKASVAAPDLPVRVSSPMCADCQRYFSGLARSRRTPQIVQDPEVVRIFAPDGSVTETYPDGYTHRVSPPAR